MYAISCTFTLFIRFVYYHVVAYFYMGQITYLICFSVGRLLPVFIYFHFYLGNICCNVKVVVFLPLFIIFKCDSFSFSSLGVTRRICLLVC